MVKNFYKQKDGEWAEMESTKGFRISCCDCGLVHRFNFRIIGERLQFQAYREKGRTKRQRSILTLRRILSAVMESFK